VTLDTPGFEAFLSGAAAYNAARANSERQKADKLTC
jgi:hypothetical protein